MYLLIFFLASYYDIKYMRVPNWIWLLAIPFAALTIYSHTQNPPPTTTAIDFMLISPLILYFYHADYMGGADLKALIFATIFWPTLILYAFVASYFLAAPLKLKKNNVGIPYLPFLTGGIGLAIVIDFLLFSH